MLELLLVPNYGGVIPGTSNYTGYPSLCGVPRVTLELCGVPRVTLELCGVPLIVPGTSNYTEVIAFVGPWRYAIFHIFPPNSS